MEGHSTLTIYSGGGKGKEIKSCAASKQKQRVVRKGKKKGKGNFIVFQKP